MKKFTLKCAKDSTHIIRVTIHDTIKAYKKAVNEAGNKEPQSVACCMQMECPNEDNLIAEMHFSKPNLNPAVIAHEAFHAAYFRAVVMGKILDTEDTEEFIAEGVQQIVESILEA